MTICSKCKKYQQCPAKPADTCKSFEASSPSMKEHFTPGPWDFAPRIQHGRRSGPRRVCGKSSCRIVDINGNSVAYAYQQIPRTRQRSNAALIAAAPEMYALLDKCESALRHWLSGSIDKPMIGETENTINEIQELLTEARGEK